VVFKVPVTSFRFLSLAGATIRSYELQLEIRNMSTPVLLLLGAGSGIGNSVASSFAAKGYKIALAARSFEDGLGSNGYLRLRLDLSNPEEIRSAFAKVTEKLGVPTVVVYNGRLPSHLNGPEFLSSNDRYSFQPSCTR